MKTKKFNDEVIYSMEAVTKVDLDYIKQLKELALVNPRKRIRLCAHHAVSHALHEMIIVHAKGAYIPPHKHVNKVESFHMVEGELKIVIFDDDGRVSEVVEMGEYLSGKNCYYRLIEGLYHTVIPLTDFVVFHETTNGPFDRSETVFAQWAPNEADVQGQTIYLKQLEEQL